jgi:hypothetical protein
MTNRKTCNRVPITEMEKSNNRRLHVIHMEMDEDEANAVDVPIDEEPELDQSELLDLEFDEEDEDADDINTEDVEQDIQTSD